MVRRLSIALLLLLIVFSGTWVLLHSGYFRAHDYVHAARIAEMQRALESGHIPPRWSANFGFGLGMPLFNFYAPLPFIVGAILYEMVSVVAAIKLLVVIATVGTAVGTYLLAREFFSRSASLLATLAATLSPYRAVNIFVRGALSEVWGIAWVPWVLLGVTRVARGTGGFFLLSLSVAGIALSHNLVTLLTLIISVTWGCFVLFGQWMHHSVQPKIILQRAARFLLGIGAGIGLASWYIFPSVLEKRFTQLDSVVLSGYFDYRLHFLYIRQLVTNTWGYGGSQWGPDDGISFFLGYGQILAVLLSVALVLPPLLRAARSWRFRISERQWMAIGSLCLLTLTLGMTLSHAQPVWDRISFLQYLQFPWRWLSVSTVLLALLVGFAVDSARFVGVKLLLLCVFLVTLLPAAMLFKPESFLQDSDALYYVDAERISTQMSQILPDYIPVNVAWQTLSPPTTIIQTPNSTQLLQHIVKRPTEHLLRVSQSSAHPVEFSIAYFPGWRAEIDGVQTLLEPSKQGLVTITIPQGEHQIGIYFVESPVRKVSNAISVFTALVLIGVWLQSRRKKATK